MASSYDEFWGRTKGAVPGLFDVGAGVYGMNAGSKEAAARLRAAQGPLYDQQMNMAGGMLGAAGSFDPNAAAKARFDQAQALLAPKDSQNMDALNRQLFNKGQMGAASFSGVDPNGAPVNPQMAAFLQEKNRRDAQMAYDSLNQGDKMLDTQLNRAGMLQKNATSGQDAGIKAQGLLPSRSAATMNLLKGVGGIAKDAGLFGMGTDWLKRMTGGVGGGGSPLDLFGGAAQDLGADWYGF